MEGSILENTVCLLTGKEVWSTVEKQIQENDNDPQIRAIHPHHQHYRRPRSLHRPFIKDINIWNERKTKAHKIQWIDPWLRSIRTLSTRYEITNLMHCQ